MVYDSHSSHGSCYRDQQAVRNWEQTQAGFHDFIRVYFRFVTIENVLCPALDILDHLRCVPPFIGSCIALKHGTTVQGDGSLSYHPLLLLHHMCKRHRVCEGGIGGVTFGFILMQTLLFSLFIYCQQLNCNI